MISDEYMFLYMLELFKGCVLDFEFSVEFVVIILDFGNLFNL